MVVLNPEDKIILDAAAVTTGVLGYLTDVMPTIALMFTIVWTGIRIYETATVQKFLGRGDKNGKTTDPE